MSTGWPPELTWYKLLTDWGSLIAGLTGFAAAIIAVWLAISSERRKAKRELKSLRRALAPLRRLANGRGDFGRVAREQAIEFTGSYSSSIAGNGCSEDLPHYAIRISAPVFRHHAAVAWDHRLDHTGERLL